MRLALLAPLLLLAACSGKQGLEAGGPRDGGEASSVRTEPGSLAAGAAGGYQVAPLDERGRVEGSGSLTVVVSWLDPPDRAVRPPGQSACGSPSRPPASFYVRDRQRHVNAVRNAVVSLTAIERGRKPDPDRPVEVGVRDCRLSPVVSRAPRVGAPLLVVTDDERPHLVVLEYLGAGASPPEPVARLPLALVGQRHELVLDRAGVFRATSPSDPHDHAYVVVPGHPYVEVTGARGSARLDQVPPGRYTVEVWHPPLEVGGTPITARSEVAIEAGKARQLEIQLEP